MILGRPVQARQHLEPRVGSYEKLVLQLKLRLTLNLELLWGMLRIKAHCIHRQAR